MTTSLYDKPLYGHNHQSSGRTGNEDDDDVNYDAIRDAKEKFYQNPDKYSPRRIYHGSTHGSSSDRSRKTGRGIDRVTVLIEHGGGCNARSVSDELCLAITDAFPDVKFSDRRGRYDAFEVFLNGRCLYSRLAQGGYPEEDEVLEAVYRQRAGKTFYPLERGYSSVCAIL